MHEEYMKEYFVIKDCDLGTEILVFLSKLKYSFDR